MSVPRTLLLIVLTACASTAHSRSDGGALDSGSVDGGPTNLRVLFIGNSYTYVNDLPGMLAKIAATAGTPPTITTDEVVQGGASLQNHWDNGIAQARIQDGGWTQVVLQDQSLEPVDRFGTSGVFFTYAKKFGDLIVDAGAQPTFFDTWARAPGDPIYDPVNGDFVSPDHMQDELTAAYGQAAPQWPHSILVCAGEAFRRSRAQYPVIVLQQSDLTHPTVAGTYLAASTFYVALTGKPVPAASAVPAGLSAQDAVHLREISQVGTNCAGVHVKGAIQASFGADTDGGAPLDWGTAGLPIPVEFRLMNTGEAAVGITDGMSLAPPFIWTTGGAYPGGTDAGFCGSSLAPGETCTLSITFTGASSAAGRLTLDYSGAYFPSATRTLRGTSTTRALLSVSESPGFFGCTDALCGPFQFNAFPGAAVPFSLVVLNRGALPVTAMGEGAPLAPPFAWAAGSFSVSSADAGTAYPDCSAGTLGVGEQCQLSLTFSPADAGTYTAAVSVAYLDAMGPVTSEASRNVEGDCTTTRLPP